MLLLTIVLLTGVYATVDPSAAGAAAFDRGDYKVALSYFEQALDTARRQGTDQQLAISLSNVSAALKSQGRYQEAHAMFKQAIELLGTLDDQRPLARALTNWALLQGSLGQWNAAELSYKRALTIWDESASTDSRDAAATMNNYVHLLIARRRYAEAEAQILRSLQVIERIEAPQRMADIAICQNNLGRVMKEQHKNKEARQWYIKALATLDTTAERNQELTAAILNNLAQLDWLDRHEKIAIRRFQSAIAIWEKALGPAHPTLASALINLATLHVNRKRFKRAEPLYKQALAIHQSVLSPDDERICTDLRNLAAVYHITGQYSAAETLYLKAIRVGSAQPDNPLVVRDYAHLADVYVRLKRMPDAEHYWELAYAATERTQHGVDLAVAKAMESYSIVLRKREHYIEAERVSIRAMRIRVAHATERNTSD